jgi:class 3 adenylate cyclase
MPWENEKARTRIRKLMNSVPEGNIQVETFARFVEGRRTVAAALGQIKDSSQIINIPRNRAITTHGVHVYANLTSFNDRLLDGGRETEASHRRALEFLHTHYSACDGLIAQFDIQRVDFHGSRLHAVVLSPVGDAQEGARITKAMAFAAAFREMVKRTGDAYGDEFRTGVRVGIDSGPAVAIDGGKRDEPEPLFIGSPANHAAKLADGTAEGIFPSQRVKAFLGQSAPDFDQPLLEKVEAAYRLSDVAMNGSFVTADQRLDEAYASFIAEMKRRRDPFSGVQAVFRFHYNEPPLSSIVFADHPPSNSIRMPLASIFADIDGFTAYIDNAMTSGSIAQAVANLHVLRGEMAGVLRDDFNGRKVRFIGDCIHGLLAKGDARETDSVSTIDEAIMASGGLRSSFELCQSMLPGISNLGLAIGIDYGQTPICRLGLRGDASVRSASSRATCASEQEQRQCKGTETAIGEAAFAEASPKVRRAFSPDRKLPNLTYANAQLLFGTMMSPFAGNNAESEPMRAHSPTAQPMRAHCD